MSLGEEVWREHRRLQATYTCINPCTRVAVDVYGEREDRENTSRISFHLALTSVSTITLRGILQQA